jgi:peptidoglycan pentaglycine glycine transferase (the first glycine)
MRQLKQINAASWNALLLRLPQAHLLQTWEWGQSKRSTGWSPLFYVWGSESEPRAAAMLLLRQMRVLPGLQLKVLYCPKGPILDWKDENLVTEVLADLENLARKEKAIFIKIDPDLVLRKGVPGTEDEEINPVAKAIQSKLGSHGWRYSGEQIQFRNTILLNLEHDEDEILAAMKQKTRYNIRLASRRGISIREAGLDDLPLLYQLYVTTAVRDDFVIRPEAYYLDIWQRLYQAGMARFLVAEYSGEAVAGLVMFYFGGIAHYFYGMSSEVQRALMPTYLLQWEAICLAKKLGCHTYDFWGAPEVLDKSDSMWGVYRFKEGFNGRLVRHLGAWDYRNRPVLYQLYTHLLPKLLNLMRKRGKAANRERSLAV